MGIASAMVILAVTICTRPGKLIVSRQFVEMTRIRIEGLIAAFPKLLTGAGKQHTFVETDNVRYLYHPLEGLYLVLITSKTSNIVQDLETLKLVSKLVTEYCPSLEEDTLRENPFDFVFAVDEVISLGYREQMSLSQVKTSMEMQSHDHRLAVLMRKEQEEEAKRRMKEKQREIDATNRERGRGGMSGKSGGGFGSSSMTGGDVDPFDSSQQTGMGNNDGGSGFSGGSRTVTPPAPTAPKAAIAKNKIKLGSKGGAKNALLDQMALEGEVVADPVNMGMGGPPVHDAYSAGPAATQMQEAVHFNIEESCNISFESDGTLEKMLVTGSIMLLCTDPEQSSVKVRVSNRAGSDFQYKTHPKLAKEPFFSSKPDAWLMLAKEGSFPCGNPLGVLKWRYQSNDEDKVPVKVTCWPSNQRGNTHVNMEYELGDTITELSDLVISFPLPGSCTRSPEIVDSCGETQFDSKNMQLHWRISEVDESNSTGALEFSLPEAPEESFFPITVTFSASQTYCPIEVVEVMHSQSNQPVKHSKNVSLKPEEFTIGAQ